MKYLLQKLLCNDNIILFQWLGARKTNVTFGRIWNNLTDVMEIWLCHLF